MDTEKSDVQIVLKLHQLEPQKLVARNVEGAPSLCLRGGSYVSFAFLDRPVSGVLEFDVRGHWRRNELHRRAVDGIDVGTQNFVAADDIRKTPLERSPIQTPDKFQAIEDCVESGSGLDLLE